MVDNPIMALSSAIEVQPAGPPGINGQAGAVKRFYEAILWRRRIRTEAAFVRRNFTDGASLYARHQAGEIIQRVQLRDGRELVHADRPGMLATLIELWHHRGYTQGLYRPTPGDIIIDAGANVGLFSVDLLRQCPGLRVLPIEPVEENRAYLRQNLANFGGDPADIAAAALGPKPGVVQMLIAERSLDHRVASEAEASRQQTVSVPMTTLEAVMENAGANRIAFLKLDIESAEYALLDRISDATLKLIDRIAIEPHPKIAKRPAQDLIDRLSNRFDVRWYGPHLQARRR